MCLPVYYEQVMDCPGLYDTSKSHEDVATMIVQAVAFTHPGPHAILFVLSAISRYTEEEHRVFERVKALFDDDATKYIIVVFTHGDDLTREDQTLEDLLKEAPDRLKELLKECNYRYVLFDNNARNKQPQVELLLQKVQKLVQENGGPYKCPKYQPVGEGLEKEIQRRVKKIEEQRPERKRLASELESTLKEAENRLKHMLEDFEGIEEGKRDMKELQAAQNEVASRKRRKEAIEKEKEREYNEEMEKMRYDVALKPQESYVKNFLKESVTSLINFLRGKNE
ncbi:hypothetical protein BaRGS_00012300 [Batillaria attramentaria]|uniref:AIG1-type G domain-containing protein n=1 Tax=Batillaria attramentaria TaxID=370345 RepID=A0ABD0LAV7_9CAEN